MLRQLHPMAVPLTDVRSDVGSKVHDDGIVLLKTQRLGDVVPRRKIARNREGDFQRRHALDGSTTFNRDGLENLKKAGTLAQSGCEKRKPETNEPAGSILP